MAGGGCRTNSARIATIAAAMPDSSTTALKATLREPDGSRSARRLRRGGAVPGIIYGGGEDPVAFAVNARELRHALASSGSVLDLQLDGTTGTPVVLKELIRHPVHGETTHVDLLRVNLNVKIQAQVLLELTGGDDSPGVKQGGVLEQPLREITIESLPTSIPDVIQHDISAMEIGDSLTLDAISAPAGVDIISEGETLVATISAPRLQDEGEDGIETETEVVGEGEAAAEGDGEGADAASDGDSAE
jgi:large subunit ribosomal protein L25